MHGSDRGQDLNAGSDTAGPRAIDKVTIKHCALVHTEQQHDTKWQRGRRLNIDSRGPNQGRVQTWFCRRGKMFGYHAAQHKGNKHLGLRRRSKFPNATETLLVEGDFLLVIPIHCYSDEQM